MPIVQDFEADFSQYKAAVADAQTTLKAFGAEAERVEAQAGKLPDAVASGSQQARAEVDLMTGSVDAFTGATRGAAVETDLLGVAVGAVAESLLGLVGLDQMLKLANDAIQSAGAFEKMAAQTGMTANEVEKLDYAAGQSSVKIESVTSAAQTLTQRLGDPKSGAAGAVQFLYGSLEDFNKLDTYDKLVEISRGMSQMTSDTERGNVARDLFGNGWKEILPLLKSNFGDVAASAHTMGDHYTAVLAGMTDAGAGFWKNVKADVGMTIGYFVDLGQSFLQFEGLLAAATPTITAGADALTGYASAAGKADKAEQQFLDTLNASGKRIFEETERQNKKVEDEARRVAAELQRVAEAYYASIDKIREKYSGEAAIADAQKYAMAFDTIGVSISQLTNKELADFESRMMEGIDGLARTGQLTTEMGDRFAAVIVQIEQFKASQVDAAAQAAAAAAAAEAAERAWTQSMYDAAVAADNESLALQRKADELKANEQAARDAAAAARELAGVFAGGAVPTADSLTAAAYRPGSMLGFSTGQMVQSMTSWNQPGGYYVPGRASGGPVTAGTPYIVGENGPELFVPSSSGAIQPNGGGGTVINNTFHLVDTASNLARQVSDILARSVTQARRV